MIKPVINELALELNITNEVGVYNTYRFLKNVMGLWIVQKYPNIWHDQGKTYSYEELTNLANQTVWNDAYNEV